MIKIDLLTGPEGARRHLALLASRQSSDAQAELLRFALEGDNIRSPFEGNVVEQLLDAAKLAMEIEGWDKDPEGETIPALKAVRAERRQIYTTIAGFLEGWA